MSEYPDLCVVTNPIGATGVAVEDLLAILTSITTVSVLTAGIDDRSGMPDDCEVVILSEEDTGHGVVVAAVRYLRNQLRMCRQIRRRDESVVLFFGSTSYLLPILFARLLGKSVILEPRGDIPLSLKLNWQRRIPTPLASLLAGAVGVVEGIGYSAATGIITYTPAMARELGLDRYSEKLYPNGARFVDTDRFSPEIPFADRELVVGYLGRLDEEKNIRTLAAVASGLPENVTFRFVGDGGLRSWLETELGEEIERGSVETVGWVDHDEVATELNRLRLLVLPSEPTEGLPTVVLESLACGTPVYATPVSGVPDVVRDGETGFLMASQEAAAMEQDIAEILSRDDLDRISEAGRTLIREEYSFEAAVDRYRAILDEIPGRGR
jgi:glycosyltransferase involved in cell wall biosynthesis